MREECAAHSEFHFAQDLCVRIAFYETQRAIAKGQAAVFRDGDIVLCGAIVKHSS